MKILFHIGSSIEADTIVSKGLLVNDSQHMCITSDKDTIVLSRLKSVELYKPNCFGTMVKVINGDVTILLCVPRLFINIGTGFSVNNYYKTVEAKKLLELSMNAQSGS